MIPFPTTTEAFIAYQEAGTGRKLKGRERLLIPVLMLVFSIAGAAFGIEEETLPFFPVLIPVLLAAGYDTLVGLSIIKMGAALGVMGSIANPFAVAIASRFAGISMTDGILGIEWSLHIKPVKPDLPRIDLLAPVNTT